MQVKTKFQDLKFITDDQLLQEAVSKNRLVWRVWQPQEQYVVAGRSTPIEKEINVHHCAEKNLPIVRRKGGGCSVVLGPGTVIVSLAYPRGRFQYATEELCYWVEKIKKALIKLGVEDVSIKGTSDLCIGNKKILGSCLYKTKDAVMFQSSLLVSFSIDQIQRALNEPVRMPDYRQNRCHKDFVTNLNQEGYQISCEDILNAFSIELSNEFYPKGVPSIMAKEIRVPQMDVNDPNALIVDWLAKEGEKIKAGQDILTIETSKAAENIQAESDGFLKQNAKIGDEKPINALIGWILENPGEHVKLPETKTKAASDVQATAKAKALAEKLGVDLKTIPNKGGIIREKDILEFTEKKEASSSPSSLVGEMKPLSRAQKIIKEGMLKSIQTNASCYIAIELRTEGITSVLEKKTSKAGFAVRLNDLLMKSLAQALEDFPSFNGFYQDNNLALYKTINIGVAVDQDELLLVPVIRDVQTKTVENIAKESGLIQMKVLRKNLTAADFEGGTFTVTNLAGVHVQTFVPIINGQQAAILAVGSPFKKVEKLNNEFIEAEYITLGLTYDHRINNGMKAARFLNSIKKYFEEIAKEGE